VEVVNDQFSTLNFQVLTIIKKRAYRLVSPWLYHDTNHHRLTASGKYDGDVYVLSASLRGKNKWLYQKSKIKFRGLFLLPRQMKLKVVE